MDREIKFRGKRIDNGEWVYGDLLNEYWISGNTFLKTAIRYKIGDYYSFPIEVDPTTVGQLTGLKDRNGKEIYFKDIVKDPSGNYFVVEWDDQEMRIVLKRQDTLYGFNVPSYEVVGNVFENPELL